MFFTKVALPEMDYVENFTDFLLDVEVRNLPVLKRVCEGYLCSELNSVSLYIKLPCIFISSSLKLSSTIEIILTSKRKFANSQQLFSNVD